MANIGGNLSDYNLLSDDDKIAIAKRNFSRYMAERKQQQAKAEEATSLNIPSGDVQLTNSDVSLQEGSTDSIVNQYQPTQDTMKMYAPTDDGMSYDIPQTSGYVLGDDGYYHLQKLNAGQEFGLGLASGFSTVARGVGASVGARGLVEWAEQGQEILAHQRGIDRSVAGYIANVVGETIPYMSANIAATMLNPAAGFGFSAMVEGGNQYETAMDEGADQNTAIAEGVVVGLINAYIEKSQIERIFGTGANSINIGKKLYRAAKSKGLKAVRSKAAGELTKEAVKNFASEAMEESLQEVSGIVATTFHRDVDPMQALKQTGHAFLAGGTMGAFFGGISSVGGTSIGVSEQKASFARHSDMVAGKSEQQNFVSFKAGSEEQAEQIADSYEKMATENKLDVFINTSKQEDGYYSTTVEFADGTTGAWLIDEADESNALEHTSKVFEDLSKDILRFDYDGKLKEEGLKFEVTTQASDQVGKKWLIVKTPNSNISNLMNLYRDRITNVPKDGQTKEEFAQEQIDKVVKYERGTQLMAKVLKKEATREEYEELVRLGYGEDATEEQIQAYLNEFEEGKIPSAVAYDEISNALTSDLNDEAFVDTIAKYLGEIDTEEAVKQGGESLMQNVYLKLEQIEAGGESNEVKSLASKMKVHIANMFKKSYENINQTEPSSGTQDAVSSETASETKQPFSEESPKQTTPTPTEPDGGIVPIVEEQSAQEETKPDEAINEEVKPDKANQSEYDALNEKTLEELLAEADELSRTDDESVVKPKESQADILQRRDGILPSVKKKPKIKNYDEMSDADILAEAKAFDDFLGMPSIAPLATPETVKATEKPVESASIEERKEQAKQLLIRLVMMLKKPEVTREQKQEAQVQVARIKAFLDKVKAKESETTTETKQVAQEEYAPETMVGFDKEAVVQPKFSTKRDEVKSVISKEHHNKWSHNPYYNMALDVVGILKRKELSESSLNLRYVREQLRDYGLNDKNQDNIRHAYDAIEAGINLFVRSSENAETYDYTYLNNLEKLFPTHTQRSDKQVFFQQFSTPIALAKLVGKLVSTDKEGSGVRYLEPSAGTGILATFASLNNNSKVVANELDDFRLSILRMSGFETTKLNAESLTQNLDTLGEFDAVIMNPPFSSTKVANQANSATVGKRHIIEALGTLKDGGRLVAVIGENMGSDRVSNGRFYHDIRNNYTLLADIKLDPSTFKNKGTSFGTRLIVIEKTKGNDTYDTIKVADENTTAIVSEELEKLLQPIIKDTINEKAKETSGSSTVQADRKQDSATGTDEGDNRGTDTVSRRDTKGESVTDGDGRTSTDGHRRDGRVSEREADTSGVDRRDVREDNTRDGSTDENGRNQEHRNDTGRRDTRVSGESNRISNVTNKVKATDVEDEGVYGKYTPSVFIEGAVEHPCPLVESVGLSTTEQRENKGKLYLPKSDITKGLGSDAQLEFVMMADDCWGRTVNQIDPETGEKKAFVAGILNGDGTGVGKGRQVMLAIKNEFIRRGKPKNFKAIVLSKNKDLFKDAQRDATDTELGLELFDLSEHTQKDIITRKSGVLFSTYSLASREWDTSKIRYKQIENWITEGGTVDFDGVVCFDEAHSMKGALTNSIKKVNGVSTTVRGTNTANFGIALQQNFPNARVAYFTATLGTSVDEIAAYSRLGLWGNSEHGFKDVEEAVEKLSSKGKSALEMVAKDLKSKGMYISRRISYQGVKFENLKSDMTPEQIVKFDEIAGLVRAVWQSFYSANAAVRPENDNQFFSTFFSWRQNFMLNVIKGFAADDLIKQMEDDLLNGKSIVVSLMNTGEEDLKRAVSEALAGRNIEKGERVPVDITLGATFKRWVNGNFPTHRFVETMVNGRSKLVESELEQDLIPALVKEKERILSKIDEIEGLPINALDRIISHFGVENVAEITGRGLQVVKADDVENAPINLEYGKGKKNSTNPRKLDYSGDYVIVPRKVYSYSQTDADTGSFESAEEKASRTREMELFQSGQKRIAIISKAGSTGISLHASNYAVNKQQRLFYGLEAFWSADEQIQSYGRVHRSNQATNPFIRMVESPLASQKRLLATMASRMQDMGAVTQGDRGALDVTGLSDMDFSDTWGSMATEAFYMNVIANKYQADLTVDNAHPYTGAKLIVDMGFPIDRKSKIKMGKSVMQDTTRMFSRLMALPYHVQNFLFREFERIHSEIVEGAKISNEYDTGMTEIAGRDFNVESDYTFDNVNGRTHIIEISGIVPVEKQSFDVIYRLLKRDIAGFTKAERRSLGSYGSFASMLYNSEKKTIEVVWVRKHAANGQLQVVRLASNKKSAEVIKDNARNARDTISYLTQLYGYDNVKSTIIDIDDIENDYEYAIEQLRNQWNKALKESPDEEAFRQFFISGNIIDNWMSLEKAASASFTIKYHKLTLTDGTIVTGIGTYDRMNENFLLLNNIGIDESLAKLSAKEVIDNLENGASYVLDGLVSIRIPHKKSEDLVSVIVENVDTEALREILARLGFTVKQMNNTGAYSISTTYRKSSRDISYNGEKTVDEIVSGLLKVLPIKKQRAFTKQQLADRKAEREAKQEAEKSAGFADDKYNGESAARRNQHNEKKNDTETKAIENKKYTVGNEWYLKWLNDSLKEEDERSEAQKKKYATGITKTMIVNEYSNQFKVSISKKGLKFMGRKTLGHYDQLRNSIVQRDLWDIHVTAHEFGHALFYDSTDLWWDTMKSTPNVEKELEELARLIYPEMEKDPKERKRFINEGLAELMAAYVFDLDGLELNYPHALAFATNLLGSENVKKFNAIREMIRAYALQGSIKRIQAFYQNKGANLYTPAGLDTLEYRIRRDVDDSLEVLNRITTTANSYRGTPLMPVDDPYALGTRFNGKSGEIAYTFLYDATSHADMTRSGDPLIDTLRKAEQAYGKEYHSILSDYLIAKRSLYINDVLSKQSGIASPDAEALIKKYDKQYANIANYANEIYDWWNRVLDYALESGLITEDLRKKWDARLTMYIPFQRKIDERLRKPKGDGSTGGGKLNTDIPVKRLKGDSSEIEDPIATMVGNLVGIISASNRARVIHSLRRLGMRSVNSYGMGDLIVKVAHPVRQDKIQAERYKKEMLDIVLSHTDLLTEKDKETLKADAIEDEWFDILSIYRPVKYQGGKAIVTINVGGVFEHYEVHQELWKALEGFDDLKLPYYVEKFLAAPADVLKLFATQVNPEFGIRNPIKDYFTYIAEAERATINQLWLPAEMFVRDLLGIDTKDKVIAKYIAMGGRRNGWIGQGIHRNKSLMRKLKSPTFMSRFRASLANPALATQEMMDLIKYFCSLTEDSTRLAEFQNVYRYHIKNGMDEENASILAFNASQAVTTNFSRGGTVIRAANRVVPFLNPQIQGYTKTMRVIKKKKARYFLNGIIRLTLPALALWWTHKDEEWYQNQSAFARATSLMFKVGDKVIRIPVPHHIGYLFMTLPTAIADMLYQEQEVGNGNAKRYFQEIIDAMIPDMARFALATLPDALINDTGKSKEELIREFQKSFWSDFKDLRNTFIPSVFKPIVDVAANESFTGAPIVPNIYKFKQVLPKDIVREDTTELMRKTGEFLGISPAVAQYVVNQYLGNAYSRTDHLLEFFTDVANGEDVKLEEAPIITAFTVKDIERPRMQMNLFYDDLDSLRQKKGSEIISKDEAKKLAEMEKASRLMGAYLRQLKDDTLTDRSRSKLNMQIREILRKNGY